MIRRLAAALLLAAAAALPLAVPSVAAEAERPIFDAHLHYSHDAWSMIPTADVVAILRRAGLKRAMVSSSSDEGTQKLYEAAPDLVLPVLRPYRNRSEVSTWIADESVIAHLEARLARYRYVAIGEYHVFGADADKPVMRRVVQLAKDHKLFLHSHSDADAIERQFAQDPDARILWAHAGFAPPETVRAMLAKHRNLWCDLAFRSDHAPGGKLDPAWRALILDHSDRFLVGTDTYTPERWFYVEEHAAWSRRWLADLPADVADRVAWKNGETIFTPLLAQPAPAPAVR